jgi:hypothetical protein
MRDLADLAGKADLAERKEVRRDRYAGGGGYESHRHRHVGRRL